VRVRPDKVQAVSEQLEQRLAATPWVAEQPADDAEVRAAAEVAAFAIGLSGKRRAARRGGRWSRLLVHFALAATVALSSVIAACGPTDSSPAAIDVSTLSSANASEVTIAAPTRGSPAQFVDLLLLDPGSDASPWAVLMPGASVKQPNPAPVLVDRQGAGLTTVGAVYSLAAQVVSVGTRDGASQFLDALEQAVQTDTNAGADASALLQRVQGVWQRDERFQAATRAIAGQPTVLDAAYNAEAAVTAGGTHDYINGVVLRVDPDNPALQVIDRSLLQSGVPSRAEDLVTVAIRPDQRSLYDPGAVINLRSVVMQKQQSDVNGQSTTFYIANAALDGARVEPTGDRVDLQGLLQTRLQRTDADLAVQAQELSQPGAQAPGVPTPTPGPQPTPQQQVIVNNNVNRYSGPSFVDDFLIWMWLSNSGFYRGPNVVIVNPPPSSTRPNGQYYYTPPLSGTSGTSGTSGSTAAGQSGTASRSTALQSARNAVSGQASGTGGGTAATSKSAADSTARASAATSKSASVAGAVSSSSVGKSTSSVSSASSSTAARSSGSVSAGSRGSSGSSGSSGSGRSGSSGGFGSSGGGKGISGSGSS
jgi:hypothetical protein